VVCLDVWDGPWIQVSVSKSGQRKEWRPCTGPTMKYVIAMNDDGSTIMALAAAIKAGHEEARRRLFEAPFQHSPTITIGGTQIPVNVAQPQQYQQQQVEGQVYGMNNNSRPHPTAHHASSLEPQG
jgi:hypothetical protein